MSDIKKHLDYIDAELKQMVLDGHFNELLANTCEGAVRYELSKLREILERNEESETNSAV